MSPHASLVENVSPKTAAGAENYISFPLSLHHCTGSGPNRSQRTRHDQFRLLRGLGPVYRRQRPVQRAGDYQTRGTLTTTQIQFCLWHTPLWPDSRTQEGPEGATQGSVFYYYSLESEWRVVFALFWICFLPQWSEKMKGVIILLVTAASVLDPKQIAKFLHLWLHNKLFFENLKRPFLGRNCTKALPPLDLVNV